MRPGGGRTKGHAFEKKIARELGLWWCNDRDAFWRVLGSGGAAHASPGKDWQPGDIVPVKRMDRELRVCIECKKTESWFFEEVFKVGKKSELMKHWKQCLDERAGRDPWLIITRNRLPVFLILLSSIWKGPLRVHGVSTSFSMRCKGVPTAIVVSWDLFRQKFRPEEVHAVLSTVRK